MLTDTRAADASMGILLRVRGLTKRYWLRGRLLRRRICLTAARDASFELALGKTLAIVGNSGSGKSTVARCVACLERPDSGEIWVNDRDIATLRGRDLFLFRAEVQMVFQDPVTAMNSRMSALDAIEEPLILQQRGTREARRGCVAELLKEVGLSPDWMNRKVTDFSGGQRQRIAIARALALKPKLLILDEAFSGLDLSTQAQVANLLLDLQSARSLTYLLISHDLTLVARMADAVAVMSAGQIVEQGTAAEIIAGPKHQETRALIAASTAFRSAFAAARLSP